RYGFLIRDPSTLRVAQYLRSFADQRCNDSRHSCHPGVSGSPQEQTFWHRGAKQTSASDCRRIAICECTHQRRAASPTLTANACSGLHARPGGWLAVIGRAASPSEKTARVNIIPQAQEEVKRQIKPEGRAALRCSARVVRGQHSRGVVSFPYAPRAREGRMTVTIGRRELLAALGGAVVTWPLAARAQQRRKQLTIGYLGPTVVAPWTAAFADRLRELGWIEGRTIAIEYRYSEGRPERVAEIAAEFVQQEVDVIVAYGGAVAILKQATAKIPIVFAIAGDPV